MCVCVCFLGGGHLSRYITPCRRDECPQTRRVPSCTHEGTAEPIGGSDRTVILTCGHLGRGRDLGFRIGVSLRVTSQGDGLGLESGLVRVEIGVNVSVTG